MTPKVVTDSTSDLSPELAGKWGITVVPCSVHFGNEVYRDRLDISPTEFFQRLRESNRLPTTSQPSVGEFLKAYQELTASGDDVLSIHISGKMSGTLSSAIRAEALLGIGGRVRVIDSRFNSVALALIVLAAAEEAAKGGDLQTLEEYILDVISRTGLFATVHTLEYAARGGRIGKAQAFVGSLLQVKPILQIKDGELHPMTRVRTRARALDRLVTLVREQGPLEKLAVFHAVCLDDAQEVAGRLKDLLPGGEVLVGEIGPVVGTYTGPGTLGVGFVQRKAS